MDNIIWAVLPFAILAVIYLIIFTRKKDSPRMKTNLRNYDWITNIAVIFGAIALINGLGALKIEIPQTVSVIVLTAFFAFLLGVVIYRIRKGKPATRIIDDERVTQIYAKGSRNALLIIFLGLLIIVGRETATVDVKWIVATIGSSLAVFFGSIFFYYYRKS